MPDNFGSKDDKKNEAPNFVIKPQGFGGFSSSAISIPTVSADQMADATRQMMAKKQSEGRISVLVASRVSRNFRNWVRANNTNIMLWVAAPVYLGASLLNKDPYIATGLAVAAPLLMNDVSINVMKSAKTLEHKGIISSKRLAAIGAALHTGSEIASAGVNAVKGVASAEGAARALAINLTSTFTANVSHFGTMFFGAAAVGRMGFASKDEWKSHAKGITGLTVGLDLPIIADAGVRAIPDGWIHTATNAVSRGVGAIVSYKYASEYMQDLEDFGDECIVCGGNHGAGHHRSHSKKKQTSSQKEPLRARFANAVQALPNKTKHYAQSISQAMTEMPAKTGLALKNAAQTSKRIFTDPAGRDAAKSVATMGLASYGMLYNIDVLSEGFVLATTSQGNLHGIAHSLPETIFMMTAAARGGA